MPAQTRLAFLGGKVFTADDKNTITSGVYVEDNRISAVGPAEEISRQLPQDTKVIDIEGKTLIPGVHGRPQPYVARRIDIWSRPISSTRPSGPSKSWPPPSRRPPRTPLKASGSRAGGWTTPSTPRAACPPAGTSMRCPGAIPSTSPTPRVTLPWSTPRRWRCKRSPTRYMTRRAGYSFETIRAD